MDRNVISCLGVIGVESFVERLDIIVKACPGHTLDRDDTDRVLVAHLQGLFGIEGGLFESQGHCAHLDLPELGEFFPDDLIACRDDEVRLVEGLSFFLTAFAPSDPRGDTAEHTGFRRTDSQRAGFPLGSLGRVPEVGDDVDALAVHYGDTRIFGFVDIVDVDGFVHQTGGIFVHIGGDECGQVESRLGLGESFVFHHLVGDFRRCRAGGDVIDGGCLKHCI